MPEKWKRQAEDIAASYVKRGMNPKKARDIGFATATKSWEKHHGGQTPQSVDKRPRLRMKKVPKKR